MPDERREARFVAGHGEDLRVLHQVTVHPLERDEPLEAGVAELAGEQDGRHPAARELEEHVAVAEPLRTSHARVRRPARLR